MANYPIFCSACGRRLGTVNDPARQLQVYYCSGHKPPDVPAPHPSTAAQDAAPEKDSDPKKAQDKPNKVRTPKENKGQ